MHKEQSSADLISRGDAADDVHDRRLFPTSEQRQLEPKDMPKRSDDLSRVRVVDRDSDEGRAILAARAARQAKQDLVNGLCASDFVRAERLVSA